MATLKVEPYLPSRPGRGSCPGGVFGPLYVGRSGSKRSLQKSTHSAPTVKSFMDGVLLMSSSVMSLMSCLPDNPCSTPGKRSVAGFAALQIFLLVFDFSTAMYLVKPKSDQPAFLRERAVPPSPSQSDRTTEASETSLALAVLALTTLIGSLYLPNAVRS